MIRYLFKRFICALIGHDWYMIDYVIGIENNTNIWFKQCDRCNKMEVD